MKADRVPKAPTGNRPDRDDLVTVDEALKGRLRAAVLGNQDTTLRCPRPTAAAAPTTGRLPYQPGWRSGREQTPRLCGRRAKAKRCFPTEAAARARLAVVHGVSYSGRGYGPVEVHHCRKCGQWHLTSKSKKPRARGRKRR